MTNHPGPEPAWLGSAISAKVTKVEVVDDAKKGKQVVVGLAMRITDALEKVMPEWLIEAFESDDEYLLTGAKLTQPGCKIGLEFKGVEGEQISMKIETANLSPGLTVKLPSDPEKRITADGCITLKMDYNEHRVKYFGDRLDQLVRFKAFSAASEQEQLPIDGKMAAAGV